MKNVSRPAILILIALLFPLRSSAMPPGTHPYTVSRDVEWARPAGHVLTLDIYVPQTQRTGYPVIIIFHGGGWLINTKAVMDSMSIYLVRHAEYIICNVNYRLLGDQSNTVTMNQIIEDVFGAVLWVRQNIAAYKGDPRKLIVTGDSAGGHLAAMIVLCGHRLVSDGFAADVPGFRPTYLPPGLSAEQVAAADGLAVQAAILSYAAFDLYAACLDGFETAGNFFWQMAGAAPRRIFGDSITVHNRPDYYQAVSPIYNIPPSAQRALPPQLCLVGSRDNLTTPATIRSYVSKIRESGHPVEYWEHEDRPHAFLDSWKNDFLGTEFFRDGRPAINRIIGFLDRIFYP